MTHEQPVQRESPQDFHPHEEEYSDYIGDIRPRKQVESKHKERN